MSTEAIETEKMDLPESPEHSKAESTSPQNKDFVPLEASVSSFSAPAETTEPEGHPLHISNLTRFTLFKILITQPSNFFF